MLLTCLGAYLGGSIPARFNVAKAGAMTSLQAPNPTATRGVDFGLKGVKPSALSRLWRTISNLSFNSTSVLCLKINIYLTTMKIRVETRLFSQNEKNECFIFIR